MAYSPADLLPVPNNKEVAWFIAYYQRTHGVELAAKEAAAHLTHLLQFYFLTKGHELYGRNMAMLKYLRKRLKKNGKDSLTSTELDAFESLVAWEKALVAD